MRTTGADFALSPKSEEGRVFFDESTITWADLSVRRSPEQTLLTTMTGKELLDLHQGVEGVPPMVILPDPMGIEATKQFEVVSFAWIPHLLNGRRKNLDSVESGPDVSRELVLRKLFNTERGWK